MNGGKLPAHILIMGLMILISNGKRKPRIAGVR